MKHAQCGAFRHAMVKVPTDWTPTFGNPVTLRCIFCDSERRLQLNNNGDIMTSRYIHPDGYTDWYEKGQRPSMADFRAAVFEQQNPPRFNMETIATAQDALSQRRARRGKTA